MHYYANSCNLVQFSAIFQTCRQYLLDLAGVAGGEKMPRRRVVFFLAVKPQLYIHYLTH